MPGIFKRLGNLWRGFMSLWIADIEKEHPEIAYENAINSMVEKYTKLKVATAAIVRRREDTARRFTQHTEALAQINADLNVALETGQDDLALVLLQKKNMLEKDVADVTAERDSAARDAESAKASLQQIQGEIKKLQAERDSNLAKLANAKAKARIQEQLEGLSVDAEIKALDGVRTHIQNQIAATKLGEELAGNDLDNRLQALRAQSGEVTAKQQLAEMKAQMAAKKAASQRTL